MWWGFLRRKPGCHRFFRRGSRMLWIAPLAALLVYSNNYGGAFHFDDFHHIVQNPAIRSPANLGRFFTDPRTFSGGRAPGTYRPVLLATFAFNYAVSGIQVWSYHFVNNLLHAANAALLFLVLVGLLRAVGRPDGDAAGRGQSTGKSMAGASASSTGWGAVTGTPGKPWTPEWGLPLFGALLFAIHPIQTEAVNYINARSNLLATFFYLAGAVLFLRWRALGASHPETRGDKRRHRGALFLGMAVSELLAAGSKEIGMTLAANLLVMDFFLSWAGEGASSPELASRIVARRSEEGFHECPPPEEAIVQMPRRTRDESAGFKGLRRRLRAHGFLITLSIFFFLFQRLLSWSVAPATANPSPPPLGQFEYLLTQPGVVLGYLKSIVWPMDLSFFRPYRVVVSPSELGFWGPLAILGVLLALALAVVYRSSLPAMGLFWFAVAVAPSSSIFPLRVVSAERRCYLGMVGISFVALPLLWWSRAWVARRHKTWRRLFLGGVLGVCLVWGVATYRRNLDWATEVSLAEAGLLLDPGNEQGWTLLTEGFLREKRLEEAEAAAFRGLELRPGSPSARLRLARVYLAEERYPEAAVELERLGKVKDPGFLESTTVRLELARAYEGLGRLDEAGSIYRFYLAATPRHPPFLAALARIAAKKGDDETVARLYRKAVDLDPSVLTYRLELALALHRLGRFSEAKSLYLELLGRLPHNPSLLYNLALLQIRDGEGAGAERSLRKVVALQPRDFQALIHLAELLEKMPDRLEDCLDAYRRTRDLCNSQPCRQEIDRRLRRLAGKP